MFAGDRPACPRGCRAGVHRHGRYSRYANPTGGKLLSIQRFLCAECGLTISVLPADRLPYRPLAGPRVEAYFNEQANTGSGPDPPPALIEAGCLRRAWARLQNRTNLLRNLLGLMATRGTAAVEAFWVRMRELHGTMQAMLCGLARSHQRSLLGDYRCLRVPA